jgi:predicted AlkP superfamily pyrophosphatase or phosphodiesterase
MKRSTLLATLVACCLSLAAHAAPPKLIVAIYVDQLRYDYLERFYDQFGEGGFRLLTDRGAFLTFAHYDYLPTVTGPGHASFLSGTTPAVHGIIGNDWFDKRTLGSVNCVSDPTVEGVGASGAGAKRSPRNFIGSNFADELRLRFRSKVVGISHKDRGAILPAGKKPTGAYWFDSASGNFITSTYYMPELPAWVREFNERKRPASYIGQTWKRLLDPSAYHFPDDAVGEASGKTPAVFDYVIQQSSSEGFETIVPTPFGNQLLNEFALAAVDGEKLGQGPQPDLLCISFSSVDAAGHRFGPYSQELQDMILRLDLDLKDLFAQLDKRIGLANVSVVLSADHGVAPTPEFASEQGLDGARVDPMPLIGELMAKLSERFGPGKYLLIPRMMDGNLYFNHDFLREKQIAPEDVGAFIREWALSTGQFQAVFTRGQLLDGRAPGLLGQKVFLGYNAERSGDVVLILKPFSIPSGGKSGTTHGSGYSYDTHIPVLFFGSAFKPGRYAEKFHITDIAPTLCAAFGMNEPSGCIGKPLVEILADQGQRISKPVPTKKPTRAR